MRPNLQNNFTFHTAYIVLLCINIFIVFKLFTRIMVIPNERSGFYNLQKNEQPSMCHVKKQHNPNLNWLITDSINILRSTWPTDQLKEFLSSGHFTGRYNGVQTEIYSLL
jgi:hypothetical protein